MNTMYGEKSLRKNMMTDVFTYLKMYEWSKEFLTDNYKSDQYKKCCFYKILSRYVRMYVFSY